MLTNNLKSILCRFCVCDRNKLKSANIGDIYSIGIWFGLNFLSFIIFIFGYVIRES